MDYLVTCSCGNDSIALIQFMFERGGNNFGVVYNDTGWSRSDWPSRVKRVSDWCFVRGVKFFITKSEGMESLVRRKKGWPMPASKMQFCTKELKEKPTLKLLERIDPNKEITVVTGRRREESQNRSDLPQWQDESPKHDGRECWNPLYMHNKAQRDALIIRAGFEPLPHSSMECYPCVCANKSDIASMSGDEDRIYQIEEIEISMGFTKNGKPRTMFRPYRAGGGVGIRQVVEWGTGGRGWKASHIPDAYKFAGELSEGINDAAYDENTKEGREFARQCDGGYCGS